MIMQSQQKNARLHSCEKLTGGASLSAINLTQDFLARMGGGRLFDMGASTVKYGTAWYSTNNYDCTLHTTVHLYMFMYIFHICDITIVFLSTCRSSHGPLQITACWRPIGTGRNLPQCCYYSLNWSSETILKNAVLHHVLCVSVLMVSICQHLWPATTFA